MGQNIELTHKEVNILMDLLVEKNQQLNNKLLQNTENQQKDKIIEQLIDYLTIQIKLFRFKQNWQNDVDKKINMVYN